MIYYIDALPIRKKSRLSFKRLRLWLYPASVVASLLISLPLLTGGKTAQPVVVSSAELSCCDVKTAVSESEITGQMSVTVFSEFAAPLDYARITSHYGYRTNPVSGKYKLHSGLDLACSAGSPIYAVQDGTVTVSEYSESYGNYIIIEHENGYQTLYAHCSELLKNKGDYVCTGERIALVGSTGNSTGPHLHIELRLDGERLDPEPFFGKFFQ